MLESVVEFADAAGVRTSVQAIRSTRLHMHPGVVEIVYVLQGALHVTVSSEEFDLEPGDFVVVNQRDPHLLEGSVDNVTALVHLDLAEFRDVDPFVEGLIFACESFDLARYLRQESLLRGLLLDVIGGAADAAHEIVRLLCAGYSLEHYYHRDQSLTAERRTKYLTTLRLMRRHSERRDVLDLVAHEQHYSKSYVSHLVKDVAAISFSDLLTYLRVSDAEHLLLTTEGTTLEISGACGFSDVKYFSRGFAEWFGQSPTEYRKRHRGAILRDDEVAEIAAEQSAQLVQEHRRRVAAPAGDPRLSITPLLLKNVGSRLDLFDVVRARRGAPTLERPAGSDRQQSERVPHLVPIWMEASDLERGFLLDGLASFDQIDATPCLVLQFSSRAATLALIDAVAARVGDAAAAVVVWLVYAAAHDRAGVDRVIDRAEEHGLAIQAILVA
ncbi:helix-turn-helix domain-containing protein [Agromyces sp. NPDC056379]|uniref:helix-turn-helix domain-containing protein n=1 Tax=unclassified Agromyces TaxID=2639701 RepID=UPI0035DC78CB